MAGIIREKPVTIGQHTKVAEMQTKAGIISVITKTALSLAQYLQPTTDQINIAAEAILKHFKGLSFDDLTLCMEMGLMGHFGPLMRFDVNIILEWLTKYAELKRVEATKINDYKPKEQNGDAVKMPDEVKKAFEAMKTKAPLSLKADGPEFTKDEENDFLYGPKGKKFKRGTPLGPSELEVEAWRIFDILRVGGWAEFGGHKYNSDEFTKFFVFSLYPNDKATAELYEYLETIKK